MSAAKSVRFAHGAGSTVTSDADSIGRALEDAAARLRGYFDAVPNQEPGRPFSASGRGPRPWRITFGNGAVVDVTLREAALIAHAVASTRHGLAAREEAR